MLLRLRALNLGPPSRLYTVLVSKGSPEYCRTSKTGLEPKSIKDTQPCIKRRSCLFFKATGSIEKPTDATDPEADASAAEKSGDDSVQVVEETGAQKEAEKVPTKKAAATFIASAAAETEGKAGTPVLSRRAVKTSATEKDADTRQEPESLSGAAKKEIRRNSKGFERFEDYFSDDDDNDTSKEAEQSTENDGDAAETPRKDGDKKSANAKKKVESKEVPLPLESYYNKKKGPWFVSQNLCGADFSAQPSSFMREQRLTGGPLEQSLG